MHNANITFIGGGNMATSLIGGLLNSHTSPEQIRVAEPDSERRDALARRFGIRAFEANADAAAEADVIVIAVKPQVLREVAVGLADTVQARRPLVMSIAAGIAEPDISRWLGGDAAVVRTMPNTPALLKSGASALFANTRVSEEQRELAESIMRAVGITVWVEDERLMDAVTAVSGSGPAYFFLLMEAVEAAGRKLGLSAETARLLTLQTALGAARMAMESDD
ncbi:MAG: pyrroline-5-carboxylate reductase, partial [Gammaproteobacteria bacterium]